MTSPTDPPREPLISRISTRLSLGGSSYDDDPEERFTRRVTIAFVALLVVVVTVVVFGVIYGIWDSNFRPIASVAGTDVSRGQWENRASLESLEA